MRCLIFVILLICAPVVTGAQINLVLNPGFEQYSHCPDYLDEIKYCDHWMSIDSSWSPPDWAHDVNGNPEYCNLCATDSEFSIPSNGSWYYNYPHSGNGMIHLVAYCSLLDSAFMYTRDYLQGHLVRSLTSGKTYSVSYFATMCHYSYFAINHIDAYFDDGAIDTTSHPQGTHQEIAPQIVDTGIINDTINWYRISGIFTASGNERLITIANFSDRAHTRAIPLIDTHRTAGYPLYSRYLIDDVSVIDCSNIPFAGNDTVIMPCDSAFLGPHEGLLPYTWYTLGSTTPIDSGGGIWVHPAHTTTYVLEQFLCGAKRYDTVVVHVWPDTVVDTPNFVVHLVQLEDVVFYPNPVTTTLNVDGVKGCNLSVCNVLGQVVLSKENCNKRERVDVGDLLPGVYCVGVMDKVTGFRVVRMVKKE